MKRNENTYNKDEQTEPLLDSDIEKGTKEEELITLYKIYMNNLNELERKLIINNNNNNNDYSISLFNPNDDELQNIHNDLISLLTSEAFVKGITNSKKVELMLNCIENKIKQFKYNYHKRNVHNQKIEQWLCKIENTFQQGKVKFNQRKHNHSLSGFSNSFYSSVNDKTNIASIICLFTIIILAIYFILF